MTKKLNKVVPEKMNSLSKSEASKIRIFPTFTIDNEDLPELKDWKVGEKYTLVMEVEQTSMRQGSEWQGDTSKDKNKIHATFKIVAIGVPEMEPMTYGQEYAEKMGGKQS